MVDVTFFNHDNSEKERKDKCFNVLSDIQSAIAEIAKLSKTRKDQRLLLQKCNELIEHLKDYRTIKKGCYDQDFYYPRNYVKNSIHQDLKKCDNYEDITKLIHQAKDFIGELQEKKEVLTEVEDGKKELAQSLKESPGKSLCNEEPCSADNSTNQETAGRIPDLGDKGEKANAQHTQGSSPNLGVSDALTTPNKEGSADGAGGLSTLSEKETITDGLQSLGQNEADVSHAVDSHSLQDSARGVSVPNGNFHVLNLGKDSPSPVNPHGITIIAQQHITSLIYPSDIVTKVHKPEIDQGNRALHTYSHSTLSVLISGEPTLTVQPPSAVEEASTVLSASLRTSSTPVQELDDSISQPVTMTTSDQLPLSVIPVGREHLEPEKQSSALEPKSDHESEPQIDLSQEQIRSHGLAQVNLDGADEDLIVPVQKQEITSTKTYIIIILASLGVMLLSTLLIKFTPVIRHFSKSKKTERQKIREELDRIMYSPSNLEEDNIYLSYSQPEYSFYDAEYEN
ncbi:PIR Superfamily Protein [Plasmodium ovale curtisi]|uniref:PIR Superfamily Protein n=1 Tax=Plasmodium ovale curtisi TaxID=864141 RepID=A0A1A8W152_PLAOA|nr:PIR Superfamily Protein [Plasmodium ovale curtisi]